jgi:hypothetical protein
VELDLRAVVGAVLSCGVEMRCKCPHHSLAEILEEVLKLPVHFEPLFFSAVQCS